jgi:putative NADH-flavin reductase
MKLLVLGATGRTGRHVTRQALARGHDVTAVVRDAISIPPHDRLRLAAANPLDADALANLLLGQDAVISCLGQRTRADAGLLQNAAAAMLQAMSRAEVRRYLVVSQGLLFPLRGLFAAVLRRMLARYIADSTAMERLVTASAVEWTIVRPPRLLDGDTSRGYRVEVGTMPERSRAMQYVDLAAFLLDAAERRSYPHAIVGLTSG